MSQTKLISYIKTLLIWVILVIVLLEISLRILGYQALKIPYNYLISNPENCIVLDSLMGIKLNPGTFQVTINQQLEYTVNQTLKNERVTYKNDSISLNQLFIYGCSYTYGMGVNDNETYPFLLDKNLGNYKIHNKAVPGYGTIHSYLQLQQDIENNNIPKTAILAYYDFHDERNILSKTYQNKLFLGLKSRVKNRAKSINVENSNQPFFNPKTDQIESLNIKEDYRPFPFVEYSALFNLLNNEINFYQSDKELAKKVSLRLITKMSKLCLDNDIIFYVALMENNNTITLDFCKQNNIKTIDCHINLEQDDYRNRPHDMHPSPIAHQKYAQLLQDFFLTNESDIQ